MPEKFDPSILSLPYSQLPKEGAEESGISLGADAPTEQQPEGVEDTPSPSEEGGKVAYSRFKKFHDRALEAENEALYWRKIAQEQQEQQPVQPRYTAPTPSYDIQPSYEGADWERFKTLYQGADEGLIRDAYRIELQRLSAIEERATERALSTLEQRQAREQEIYAQNRSAIDEGLNTAADIIGRDLTPDEQMALLEIQDDYSPKDRSGNIVALLPVERAVEIFEMQAARAQNSPRRQARNAIANIGSTASSGGDTSVGASSQEQNSKFVPTLGWRANFSRTTGRDANKLT